MDNRCGAVPYKTEAESHWPTRRLEGGDGMRRATKTSRSVTTITPASFGEDDDKVASSSQAAGYSKGFDDTQVSKWIRIEPYTGSDVGKYGQTGLQELSRGRWCFRIRSRRLGSDKRIQELLLTPRFWSACLKGAILRYPGTPYVRVNWFNLRCSGRRKKETLRRCVGLPT